MREIESRPSAAALIESMRDFGYTLETAIADIVDNSITAGASKIGILSSVTDGTTRIGILDDGVGMTEDELFAAMKLGSTNPLEHRKKADLGRFGLGLKTASFSQCRRLTVISRQNGVTVAARWDLDLVQERNEWMVQIPDDVSDLPWVKSIGKTGTLVLWEHLDRFSGHGPADSEFAAFLNSRLTAVARHLELVFHRFISGERGLKRVKMTFNSRPLEAYDPFNSSHVATYELPMERIPVSTGTRTTNVEIQGYVLPHFARVTKAEWERFEGLGGYSKNQGFYVYREKRLIVFGTWFNLIKKSAAYQLARVRVDITNELDSEWKIDVKKSSAELPFAVRRGLKNVIDQIAATSARPFIGRLPPAKRTAFPPIWLRETKHQVVSYTVNSAHPLLGEFKQDLSDDQAHDFDQILKLISAALPLELIYSDFGSNPKGLECTPLLGETADHLLRTFVKHLRAAGLDNSTIKEAVLATPEYCKFLAEDDSFLNNLLQNG